MSNKINRITAVLAVLGGLITSSVLGQDASRTWGDQAGSTYQQWQFDSSANPAVAQVNTGGAATGAAIALGEFADGWTKDAVGLGNKTGCWDLGRNGTITVPLPANPGNVARQIAIRVSQWLDGAIYNQLAAVTVPGARPVDVGAEITKFASVGGWVVDQTYWEVDAGVAADSVVVTSASNGSVVDVVSVETLPAAIADPVQLSVRPLVDRFLEISWAATAGTGTVEWSADMANAQGWTAVDAQAQVNGDRYVVTIQAGESLRFFRLKQP